MIKENEIHEDKNRTDMSKLLFVMIDTYGRRSNGPQVIRRWKKKPIVSATPVSKVR